MRQRFLVAALSAALAAALFTPVSAQSREQRQMMADLRILQVQAQEMQNLIGAMNQTVNEALKALNARLDEQAKATVRSFAEQKTIIDTLSSDLRVVREKLDDNNVRVGSLTQEVDSLRDLITALPRGGDFTPAPDGGDPLAGGAPPAGGVGASPEKFWNMAMSDFWSSDYDLAVSGFTSYLTSFPDSERADDAQFYIGQSYYNAGKYDQAINAYEMAIRTYPKSDLLPDVYFKLGESYRALKQIPRARAAYQQVVKAYPDSSTAPLAQQRLDSEK
jgi:tol-pal system protein YbgF